MQQSIFSRLSSITGHMSDSTPLPHSATPAKEMGLQEITAGGIAGVARSVADAEGLLRNATGRG